jgi:hypothetical protein
VRNHATTSGASPQPIQSCQQVRSLYGDATTQLCGSRRPEGPPASLASRASSRAAGLSQRAH